MMNKLFLFRCPSRSYGTFGTLVLPEDRRCYSTLELPWKDNKKDESCVPSGDYEIEYTQSPSHGTYSYEILDVPGRTGIRFDIANRISELLGCVAVGMNIGHDGTDRYIEDSRIAIKSIERLLNYEKSMLRIMWSDYLL